MSTRHTVGAFQAKNTLGTLLDWVEAGDEVLITRRGKEVARLVNVRVPVGRGGGSADAAARIRTRAAGTAPMHWNDWKSLRDEGRR